MLSLRQPYCLSFPEIVIPHTAIPATRATLELETAMFIARNTICGDQQTIRLDGLGGGLCLHHLCGKPHGDEHPLCVSCPV